MISSMRKAAAVIQSATTAGCQGQLSMAIYHEKCVAQVMSKLTATKTEGKFMLESRIILHIIIIMLRVHVIPKIYIDLW